MKNDRLELVNLYQLQLLSAAQHYDISSSAARKLSAKNLVKLFLDFTHIIQPKLFVEAGAETAETSINVRKLVPAAEIHAFEANSYNHSKYGQEFDHKKFEVNYLNMALSDTSGEISFYVRTAVDGKKQNKVTGKNSILKRTNSDTDYEEVTVEATTLDDYFPESEHNGIWVDVEGATRQVLSGASNFLQNTQIALVEVEDRKFWADQWLSSDTISFMVQQGLIPVARDFEYRSQFNILFLGANAFSRNDVRRKLQLYHSSIARQ